MSSKDFINRRLFLGLLGGSALILATPRFAKADDDGDSGGGGDSGSDGDSGDGDDSGSGGSDDGGDDNSDDSGGDDSSSGSNSSGGSGSGSGKRDQDKAKDAVRNGNAIPLSKALALLKKKHDGRVIEVLYLTKGARIDYRFKIVGDNGKITSVTMDARSGRIRGFFGF